MYSIHHASGAYQLAWEKAQIPLQGEKIHAWFIKAEAPEPLQLPRYWNTGIECVMAKWMLERKRWDAAIAKRASLGRALTPSSAKSYEAFLANPFRKLVYDVKHKIQVHKTVSASTTTLKDCIVVEIKMALDPAHLSLRIGAGPQCHLFVRQFDVVEAGMVWLWGMEYIEYLQESVYNMWALKFCQLSLQTRPSGTCI